MKNIKFELDPTFVEQSILYMTNLTEVVDVENLHWKFTKHAKQNKKIYLDQTFLKNPGLFIRNEPELKKLKVPSNNLHKVLLKIIKFKPWWKKLGFYTCKMPEVVKVENSK